ncbi:MAG: hypothetical protein FJ077_05630 [Cyanobacteria bacterium K_DeepCast_35m_m2_023]|nr:hypothetical protein [Cyanobacteria bacterium K_DeepCast_35m_m2_023]
MERDPRLEALAEIRAWIAAMEALLEELPAMFEAKFQDRLQPLLDQQQRLLSGNADLRQQVLLLQGSDQVVGRRPRLLPLPGRRRLQPAPSPGDDAEPPTGASAVPTRR